MSMSLTRAGLISHYPGRKHQARRPRSVRTLLAFWQLHLEHIEDGFTLADLVALLRDVRGIAALAGMVACDIPGLLDEAELGPLPRGSEGATLYYLRVQNRLEPGTYVPHPGDTRHGWRKLPGGGRELIPGETHGFWTGPYTIYRDLIAWGEGRDPQSGTVSNRFMVEFEGVRKLLDLPLRYVPEAVFLDRVGPETGYRTEISITFGEFVAAILGTIGRFGSEDERREMLESMEPDREDDADIDGTREGEAD